MVAGVLACQNRRRLLKVTGPNEPTEQSKTNLKKAPREGRLSFDHMFGLSRYLRRMTKNIAPPAIIATMARIPSQFRVGIGMPPSGTLASINRVLPDANWY